MSRRPSRDLRRRRGSQQSHISSEHTPQSIQDVETGESWPSPSTSTGRSEGTDRDMFLDQIQGSSAGVQALEAASPTTTTASSSSSSTPRPRVLGIHHLKFSVSNLDISIAWYERVLGARRVPALDHTRPDGSRFAVICKMPDWSGLYLELRLSAARSQKARGWDPITLVTRTRGDLLLWISWLDRYGTTHSPLLIGVRGWLLVFEDPDGRRFKLFTRESHDGTLVPSINDYWLSEN